jgi:MFS family permease
MDFFGYRRMLIWGMMSTSVAALAFAIDHKHPVAVVIFASLFNMCSIVAWNALDIACVDAVPVASRSSVYAVLSAGGRVGAISAQFVNASLEKSVGVLLFVTTSCMLLGGLVSYKVEGGDKLATPTDGVRGSL